MKFRELSIGDTFDFIGPDRMLNSFYERCIKTSARTYRDVETQQKLYRVGSIDCEVYHVNQGETR